METKYGRVISDLIDYVEQQRSTLDRKLHPSFWHGSCLVQGKRAFAFATNLSCRCDLFGCREFPSVHAEMGTLRQLYPKLRCRSLSAVVHRSSRRKDSECFKGEPIVI